MVCGMDTPPPQTESRLSPYFKGIALGLGIVTAIPGSMALYIQSEISQNERLSAIFSTRADHVTYSLAGAHIVVADYSGARYTFNFNDKTVFATWPGDDRPGGGIASFRGIDNPARAEATRVQGCLIAERAPDAVNPGFHTSGRFTALQAEAAFFLRTYCP